MIIDTASPSATSTQQAIGTIDLACSLIRSRQTWLTEAFSLISQQDYALPRTLVDTVEVQIGPHIFSNTRFYLVAPPPSPDTHSATMQTATDSTLPPPLAFEFDEASGDLLCLPKDFGVDRECSGKSHVLCYFYAHPTKCTLPRGLSLIRQQWPHYYSAEKTYIRINFVIRDASDRLIDILLDYADAHRTTVWRQYRQTLCHPHPQAKFYSDFLPAKTGERSVSSEAHMLVCMPSILRPQPQLKNSRINSSEQVPDKVISRSHNLDPSRGGKGGYDLAAAVANMDARDIASRFKFETDNEVSDAEEETDQLPVVSVKMVNAESEPEPVPASDSPVEIKTRRPTKRGPYKRRGSTKQKPRPRSQRLASSSATSSPPLPPPPSASSRSRVCKYCGCKETPIWRRGPAGTGTLCNACGVKWKLGKILK
ncbi:hypothetical protein FB645_005825 [Coemansia sp. IMI 203386]|nr:hypothetical protein FB645_005825 [Coemansia sp. IMI 203386]